MTDLSEALAASSMGATPFTRSLFAEDQWSASDVVRFVNERRNATIATTNTRGQPHAAVVIAGSVRDQIFFSVSLESVLSRNLAASARLAFSICDNKHAVMGQGLGVRVGAAPDLSELLAELAQSSDLGRFTPDDWTGDIYRIEIRRIFAN